MSTELPLRPILLLFLASASTTLASPALQLPPAGSLALLLSTAVAVLVVLQTRMRPTLAVATHAAASAAAAAGLAAPVLPATALAAVLGLGCALLRKLLDEPAMPATQVATAIGAAAPAPEHAYGALASGLLDECLDAGGIGSWMRDLRSGALRVDGRYAQMLGFTLEEYGDPELAWLDCVHPEDLFRLQTDQDERLRDLDQGRFSVEYRMRHRDGRWLWFLDSGSVLERSADGAPLRVAGVHIDITARKQAEQELSEAKDYAERLIAGANAIVVGLDMDGQVESMNPAAERATGYRIDELRGRSWYGSLLPWQRAPEMCQEIVRRARSGRPPTHWEYPILTRGGEERFIVWQNSLLLRRGELAGTLAFGIDVTERKRADEQLRAEQRRFESLVDTTEGIVWEAEADSGRFTYVSAKAERLLGYPLAEWYLPGFWRSHLAADSPDEDPQAPLLPLGLDPAPQGFLRKLVAAAGHPVWLHVVFSLQDDGQGQRLLRGVMVDVSDQRAPQALLERSQELLRRTAQVGAIGGWEFDAAHERLDWTEETFRIYDAGSEFVPSLAAMLHRHAPRDREVLEQALRLAREHGQSFDLTLPARSFAGQAIWLRLVGQAEPGPACRIYGTVQDVSERRRAELAADANRSRLQLALRAGGIGIWEVDLESNAQFWDMQMYQLFGREPGSEAKPAQVLVETLEPASLARSRQALAEARERDVAYEDEYAIRAADGSLRYLRVHAAVLPDPSSGRRRLVGATWDYTAQRLAEMDMKTREALLQRLVEQQTITAVSARQRAERAAAMQSEFLANVSHELRSPLHVILGFLDLADEQLAEIEELPEPISAPIRHKLQRAVASSKRLLALVDDLLDLAKLESGRMQLSPEPCKAAQLIDGALAEFEPLLTARRLRLQRNLPDIAVELWVDERRIAQVLRNLLANALRFSPDAGCITLSLLAPEGGAIEIVIEDEGPGVPPEETELIFDKFVQSSRTTISKAGTTGTGLGLPIAREIMRAHGGDIVAGNRESGGACFRLRFPAPATASAADTPASTGTTA